MLHEEQLFTLAVAIAVVVILARVVANRLAIPEAILLVVLGVLASLIPAVPNIHLPPNVVLLLFLPPLIYNAAFFSAPRETRDNAVPITALAIGATIVTMLAVAGTTKLVLPHLGWPAALALGAAVAPTDPVAATSVLKRLGAPPRIVTILEGEGLINDGVALTAFGLAVEAMAHPFTFSHGLFRLFEVVVGGIAFGLLVGWLIGRVRRHVHDPGIQIMVVLLTPFIAYIPAEELHLSGVLATVTAGLYLSTRSEGLLQPASRASGGLFWHTLIFILESALFVLLGLQLRSTVDDLSGVHSIGQLVGAAAAVVGAAVAIRLIWELLTAPVIRFVPTRRRAFIRNPWRQRLVIGWGGLRGAIALAIAFTLPVTINGAPFTERSTLIFLAAAVVVCTLIGQGLTLTPLLRVLGMTAGERDRTAELRAREKVVQAGLDRLDTLAEAGEVDEDTAELYRRLFEMRLDRARAALDDTVPEDATDTHEFRAELLRAQRTKLNELYRNRKINTEVRRSIARTLDMQEPREFPR